MASRIARSQIRTCTNNTASGAPLQRVLARERHAKGGGGLDDLAEQRLGAARRLGRVLAVAHLDAREARHRAVRRRHLRAA